MSCTTKETYNIIYSNTKLVLFCSCNNRYMWELIWLLCGALTYRPRIFSRVGLGLRLWSDKALQV